MCECIQQAYDAGDTELDGYDLMSATIWFVCGRAFHHLARRVQDSDPLRAADLRDKVALCIEATRKLCNSHRLAEVHAQMLYNVSVDAEVMLGEYTRPDNIDF